MGFPKESPNSVRHFLRRAEMTDRHGLQLVARTNDPSAETVCFHMIPHQLVRIELWAVRRQEEQAKTALGALHKLERLAGSMRWMAVDDQEDRMIFALQKSLQEVDEDRGVHASFCDREAQFASRADGGDQVHAEPLARRWHNGGLTSRRRGCARVKVGANTRLIRKGDRRLLLLRKPSDLGELLGPATLHRFGVLRVSATEWLLRRQSALLYQGVRKQPDAPDLIGGDPIARIPCSRSGNQCTPW